MVPIRRGDFSEYREATGTPGKVIGPNGPYWRRGDRPQEVGSAPFPNLNWTRGGGATPSFLLPLSPFPFPPLLWKEKGGRILLGTES